MCQWSDMTMDRITSINAWSQTTLNHLWPYGIRSDCTWSFMIIWNHICSHLVIHEQPPADVWPNGIIYHDMWRSPRACVRSHIYIYIYDLLWTDMFVYDHMVIYIYIIIYDHMQWIKDNHIWSCIAMRATSKTYVSQCGGHWPYPRSAHNSS